MCHKSRIFSFAIDEDQNTLHRFTSSNAFKDLAFQQIQGFNWPGYAQISSPFRSAWTRLSVCGRPPPKTRSKSFLDFNKVAQFQNLPLQNWWVARVDHELMPYTFIDPLTVCRCNIFFNNKSFRLLLVRITQCLPICSSSFYYHVQNAVRLILH